MYESLELASLGFDSYPALSHEPYWPIIGQSDPGVNSFLAGGEEGEIGMQALTFNTSKYHLRHQMLET